MATGENATYYISQKDIEILKFNDKIGKNDLKTEIFNLLGIYRYTYYDLNLTRVDEKCMKCYIIIVLHTQCYLACNKNADSSIQIQITYYR